MPDLEHCILNLKRAVQFTEDGHPSKPGYLSNLAGSQLRHFEHLGELIDLTDAISNLQKSIQSTDRHLDKAMYICNLGPVH
jgi:hypothetical protein